LTLEEIKEIGNESKQVADKWGKTDEKNTKRAKGEKTSENKRFKSGGRAWLQRTEKRLKERHMRNGGSSSWEKVSM